MELLENHGNISKQTCEEILSEKGKNGAFLIRSSETIQGVLCLCVYKNKVIYTYRIMQTHTGYYTLQTTAGVAEKYFKTLEELIQNYRKRGQGLITRLRYPVRRDQQKARAPPPPPPALSPTDYEEMPTNSEYVMVLPS